MHKKVLYENIYKGRNGEMREISTKDCGNIYSMNILIWLKIFHLQIFTKCQTIYSFEKTELQSRIGS